jgi:hypothetical protein
MAKKQAMKKQATKGPATKKPAKADAPPDPDRLIRQTAGSYRTEDERFEARQADIGWFLVDLEETNEFGQELIHGPFATLKYLRDAIPGSRGRKVVPIRGKAKPSKAPKRTRERDEPPPPPPSWIDQLPVAEGRAVRRLIAALERDGVANAEELARRDRDGLLPAVASTLIRQRLEAVVAKLPPKERDGARGLMAKALEILTADGTRNPDPLPGWVLVEIPAGGEHPKQRRIDLGE